MKILLNKKSIIFSVIISAFLVSIAYAQSVSDIKYPIKELGDCGSKEECKDYCDEEKNMTACRVFARKNQLKGSGNEAKFEVVNIDGGPGGCAKEGDDPISSCSNYCDDTAHMKECVAYAKTHSLMDGEHLAEAEKVISALERGAKLPDGCKNRETCERVCENPANVKIARQCFAFAKEAGLLPPEVSDEQAEKMFKAIEEGRAPFKSPKEFEKCENPQSEEIMEKCINFALENGEGTFPPELQSCIELKIGSDGLKKLMEEGPTPELDEKMRSCFEIRNEEETRNMPPTSEPPLQTQSKIKKESLLANIISIFNLIFK